MSALQSRFLEAQASGDAASLVSLYTDASDTAATEEASGFFLTHAYVYALEAGLDKADALRMRLIAMGRDTPL